MRTRDALVPGAGNARGRVVVFLLAAIASPAITLAVCACIPDEYFYAPSDARGDASFDSPLGSDGEMGGGSIDCGAGVTPCVWCDTVSPKPLFCTDFDEHPFDYGCTAIVPGPGVLGADTMAYRSRPNGLFSLVPASMTSGNTYAYLSKTFTGLTQTEFTFAFDLLLEQMASGPHALVAELNIGANHSLDLAVATGDASVQEVAGSAIVQHALTVPPSAGVWARMQIVLTTGASPHVAVTMNGAQALASSQEPLDPSWTAGDVTIIIGFAYITAYDSTWRVAFDNVTFDAK